MASSVGEDGITGKYPTSVTAGESVHTKELNADQLGIDKAEFLPVQIQDYEPYCNAEASTEDHS